MIDYKSFSYGYSLGSVSVTDDILVREDVVIGYEVRKELCLAGNAKAEVVHGGCDRYNRRTGDENGV